MHFILISEKLEFKIKSTKWQNEGWTVLQIQFATGSIFHLYINKNVVCMKQITSPGWMHETSAWTWCTGKTQRDRVEREVGGGIGMGNKCISMADSCQCMTKTTTIL